MNRIILGVLIAAVAVSLLGCPSGPASDTAPSIMIEPGDIAMPYFFKATLSSDTPGASLYYTLGDEDPTESSPKYARPIPITVSNRILRAIAVSPEGISSPVSVRAWGESVDFPGSGTKNVAPKAGVLPGCRVSRWNGPVDWGDVAADGIRFAFIAASYAATADTSFATNWAEAKTAGIARSAEHEFRNDVDPTAQAQCFLSTVDVAAGDLPPTITVDANSGGLSPEELALALVEFIEPLIEAGFDLPIIRTGWTNWTDEYNLDGCTGFCWLPLYIAHWTTNTVATIPNAWSEWTFWEHSSTGSIGGITGNTYLIRFNGDEEDLDAMRAP